MQKKCSLLIILCITFSLVFSQDTNRIEVLGRIIVDSVAIDDNGFDKRLLQNRNEFQFLEFLI